MVMYQPNFAETTVNSVTDSIPPMTNQIVHC